MADGLLLDLGMSSEQLEHSGRGFSFMRNEPLDMRYFITQNKTDQAQANANSLSESEAVPEQYEFASLTAAEIINSFNEKDLADIFFQYGEERFSRRIARKIIEERKKKRILTTFDFVEVIKKRCRTITKKEEFTPPLELFRPCGFMLTKNWKI